MGSHLCYPPRGELSLITRMDSDLETRELCPDGTCIGVIGADGRCRVCGRVSPLAVVDPRLRALRGDHEMKEDAKWMATGATPLEPSLHETNAEPELFDEENRELCPDGTCIGLIGPDGRCKECRSARDSSNTL
jgi:hypothetical protein